MKVIPAIDIKNGKCVRLMQGDFSKSTIYEISPLNQAKIFENAGFNFYCTDRHYVQHQVGYSVIAKNHKDQQSNLFVE